MSKNAFSTLLNAIEIIIVAIFAVAIIGMLSLFFMFPNSNATPKFFGDTIFYSNVSNMSPAIPQDTAVFGNSDNLELLRPGDVVICSIGVAPDKLTAILRIQEVQTENNQNFYIVKGDTNAPNEVLRLASSDIIAKATSYGNLLGAIIRFSTTKSSILIIVVIPCVLLIALQIFKIIRINRMDDDNDDEEYDIDDVVFSTKREEAIRTAKRQQQQPPSDPIISLSKKLNVDDLGKAEYRKHSTPTASYNDLNNTPESRKPIRTSAPVGSNEPRHTNVNNNADYDRGYERTPPRRSETIYERPSQTQFYDGPQIQHEQRLDPPAVKNPRDISIPPDAHKPTQTIAPPPKKNNNKTVEELMRVIDQAQTDLKK